MRSLRLFSTLIVYAFTTRVLANVPVNPPMDQPVRVDSFWDSFPYLGDFILLALAGGIFWLLYLMFRTRAGNNDFSIRVDEQDIVFHGKFPMARQQAVAQFLRDDCQIPGSYEVRGHWEDRLLIVTVRGLTAKPYEQRIRNFLKITCGSSSPGPRPPGGNGGALRNDDL